MNMPWELTAARIGQLEAWATALRLAGYDVRQCDYSARPMVGMSILLLTYNNQFEQGLVGRMEVVPWPGGMLIRVVRGGQFRLDTYDFATAMEAFTR